MVIARAVRVGFFGDSPQPTTAREKALAPIPITLLTRFIALSYVRTNDEYTENPACFNLAR